MADRAGGDAEGADTSLWTSMIYVIELVSDLEQRKKAAAVGADGATEGKIENGGEFRVDDEVFVKRMGAKFTGRGVVLAPVISDAEHKYHGRVLIRFHDDQSTAHVRPSRMVKVASDRDAPRILLCEKTREFRRLARAQLTKDDFCVELGCSWGEASHLLAQRCSRLIGLDNSHKAIAACRQKYPELVFEQLDCLKETERLCELAAGCTKLFVDIGGNRELPALVCVLRVVLQRLRPPLVVVKNEAMYSKGIERLEKFGVKDIGSLLSYSIPEPVEWWRELQVGVLSDP